MILTYVTTNAAKVDILRTYLELTGVDVVQSPIDLEEPRGDDVTDVAWAKAQQGFQLLGIPMVALDAGFFIHVLNGFPGPYMKMAVNKLGIERMLKMVAGDDRSCTFRKCLAFISPRHPEPQLFVATATGTLSDRPRGTEREPAPFNRLFIPDGTTRALTEFSSLEQQHWYAGLPLQNADGVEFSDWITKHLGG